MVIITKYGKIEGIKEKGCDVYRGIPYAKAPTGELRFRKPVEMDSWEGVFKADHFGYTSMQDPKPPEFYLKEFHSNPDFDVPTDEDGLNLNIWVPEHDKGAKLPVAVYVHGGAFMCGSGSELPFVGTNLAKAGVIVVTINYRLGVFGFLCHPALSEGEENPNGGNYGLWDQLAAIKWIKENITAFDGDPANITAFGQSAGAMSLQCLAVSEKTKGFVNKMILQSGAGYKNPLGFYRDLDSAMGIAEDLFELLGFSRTAWKESEELKTALLNKLRSISANELLDVAGEVIGKSFSEGNGLPFVPAIDGELILKNGNDIIEEGGFLDIPYLIGSNGNDLTTEGQDNPTPDNSLMHACDVKYANFVNEKNTDTAYVYYFDRKLPGDDAGAFHSGELWYVFGSLEYGWRPWEAYDYELSKEMIGYWSNFMKNGNPNGAGSDWRPCTASDPYFKIID